MAARSGDAWEGDWQYSKPVVEALGASTDAAVPDTTDLYRKLLASADHRSVTIVTVGPLANILYLLNSGPDQHSRKTGRALVSEKVKEFIIMGGQYPSGEDEWNFNGDMPGVTRKVLAAIDVPVIFSGFEVGEVVRTGVEFNDLDPSHPLHAGYLHFSEHAPWMKERFVGDILDNASFDQTAVLYAVRGGVPEWWTLSEPGRVVADDVGGNGWESDDAGQHRYLVMTGNPDEVASVIRDAMLGPEGAPEAQ